MREKVDRWLEPDGLTVLAGWARDGLTGDQIAARIGVRARTFAGWMRRFPSIAGALKRGREVVDIEVEDSLLRKCRGYTVSLRKPFKVKRVEYDPQTGKKTLEVEELHTELSDVYVAPDTSAMIFWLSNRKSEAWRGRREEMRGDPDGAVTGVAILPEVLEDEG